MACVIALLNTQFAYGAPSNGQVVAGDAVISGIKDMLIDLSAGRGAIINWGAFDTASDEKVTFNFAAGGGAVLNRVTGGGGASNLAGLLTTTGSPEGMVFIINPQGVTWSAQNSMIGYQAAIPYLTLSSLNVSNEQFINFMNSGTGRLNYSNTNLDGVHPSLIAGGSYTPGMIDLPRGMVGINDSPTAANKGIALIGGSIRITPPGTTYSLKVATQGSLTIAAGTNVTIDGKDFSSWSDFKSGPNNTVQLGAGHLNWRVLIQAAQLNVLGNSIAIYGGKDNTDETRLEPASSSHLVKNPDGSYAPNHVRLVAANEATQTGITGNERIEDRGLTMSAAEANTIFVDKSKLRIRGKSDDANLDNKILLYGGNIILNAPVYDPDGITVNGPIIDNLDTGAGSLWMVAANTVGPDGSIITGKGNNIVVKDAPITTRDAFIVGNAVSFNGQLTAEGLDGSGSGLAAIFAGNSVKFSAEPGTGITSGVYQAGADNGINIGKTGSVKAENIELRANSIANSGTLTVNTEGSANLYAFRSMDEYAADPNKITVTVDNTSNISSTGAVENSGTVFALGKTVSIAGADAKTDILAVDSASDGVLPNTGLTVTADASEADTVNAPFDTVTLDKTAKTAVVSSSTWALWKANTAAADAAAAAVMATNAQTAADQAAADAAAAAANAAAAKAIADQAALDAAAAAASGSPDAANTAAAAAAAAAKAAMDADIAKTQAAAAQAAAEQAAAEAATAAAAARTAAEIAAQAAAKAPADKADAAKAASEQAAARAEAAETAAANSAFAAATAKTSADNAAADAVMAAAQAAVAKTEAAKLGVTEETLQAAADAAAAAVNAAAARAAADKAAAEADAAATAALAARAAADQAAQAAADALAASDVAKAKEAKAAAVAAKAAADAAAADAAAKADMAQTAAAQASLEAAAAQAAAAKTPITQAQTDAAAAGQSSAAARAAADRAAAAKANAEQAAVDAARALAKAAADADATLPPEESAQQLSGLAVVQNKMDHIAAIQTEHQFPAEHTDRTAAPSDPDNPVTVPKVR